MPWQALLPLIALALAFNLYCLIDLQKSEVKHLPKWAWALVIVFVSAPIGGIVYLAAGRRQA